MSVFNEINFCKLEETANFLEMSKRIHSIFNFWAADRSLKLVNEDKLPVAINLESAETVQLSISYEKSNKFAGGCRGSNWKDPEAEILLSYNARSRSLYQMGSKNNRRYIWKCLSKNFTKRTGLKLLLTTGWWFPQEILDVLWKNY